MMRKVPDAAWLALAFLASRAVLLACGLHFNFDLDWFVLPDPVYLRDDLLRTLWNFHSFPPGWAALTGVLLKLSPEHTAVLAQAVFIGLGLLLTLSLFSLARLIGLSRGGAMALALGFSLTPPALYFENLYHYEFIVTALLTWSAVLFHRALRARSARAWAGFFAVCAALGFFRSMMPLSWFLVVAGLAVLLARRARKQVLLGALLPLVALLGLSLKNLVVFGVFGAHTQDGNLLMATADQLPDDVHRAWEAEGKLSHFGKRPFAGPRTFLPSFPDEPQWAHPTLTDLERPSFGSPNFNHWVFLRVNVERRRDVLAYLREYPGAFVERAWNRGLRASLSPSTRWHPRTGTAASPHFEHRRVLGAWEDLWNRFVHESFFAPVGLYALLPVGLLWAAWRARRLLAADDDAQRALGGWWCFVLAQVLWVGALMSAATVGEHARYRFVIEAFLWLVMAGAVSDLVSRLRWRRAQAQGRAMVSALVLSVQLMTADPALMPPPQPVKLLPVWVPAAVGGATQTLAVLALIGVDSLRRCPPVTKDPCLFGVNFQLGLFISAVAIHAVVAISTGVLGIINAVRVGEAKKKQPAVTFDGVAFHF